MCVCNIPVNLVKVTFYFLSPILEHNYVLVALVYEIIVAVVYRRGHKEGPQEPRGNIDRSLLILVAALYYHIQDITYLFLYYHIRHHITIPILSYTGHHITIPYTIIYGTLHNYSLYYHTRDIT